MFPNLEQEENPQCKQGDFNEDIFAAYLTFSIQDVILAFAVVSLYFNYKSLPFLHPILVLYYKLSCIAQITKLIKAIASHIKYKYFLTIQKGNFTRFSTHTEKTTALDLLLAKQGKSNVHICSQI